MECKRIYITSELKHVFSEVVAILMAHQEESIGERLEIPKDGYRHTVLTSFPFSRKIL